MEKKSQGEAGEGGQGSAKERTGHGRFHRNVVGILRKIGKKPQAPEQPHKIERDHPEESQEGSSHGMMMGL